MNDSIGQSFSQITVISQKTIFLEKVSHCLLSIGVLVCCCENTKLLRLTSVQQGC